MLLYAFFIQADTAKIGYKIGYQIGSWLPFILLFIVALGVIVKGYRHPRKD